MNEKPILFSSEMVQAILAGRKTQTRRVIEPQPIFDGFYYEYKDIPWLKTGDPLPFIGHLCPHGVPGDQLWVRESWRTVEVDSGLDGVLYKADNHFQPIENTQAAADLWCDAHKNAKHGKAWRPSIHMYRWMSRIMLCVVNVRVERLQDISEEDAIAEGLVSWKSEKTDAIHYGIKASDVWEADPRITYKRLWDKVNSDRGYSFESNPWVWVISFKVVKP